MYIDVPDCIQIRGDRLLVIKCFEEFEYLKKKSDAQVNNEKNLRSNSPSGHINRKIRLQMNRIISNWIESVQVVNRVKNPKNKHQFTFVTLTLPAKQMHTDKELHAMCLNRFVETVKRKYGVVNYLWRAEKQKNQNLHYHLIIDKYIHWFDVQKNWNNLMNATGYIEVYKKNQQEFHKEGFKVRSEKVKFWSVESQKKAYLKGVKEDWQNPNSTDIHKPYKINNIVKYISKYVTKSDLVDELEMLKSQLDNGSMELEEYENIKCELLKKIDAEKIEGRVWGCSDSLKELKDPIIIDCVEVVQILSKLEGCINTKKIIKENCTIFYNSKLSEYLKKFSGISKQIQWQYFENYRMAYGVDYNPKIKKESLEVVREFVGQSNVIQLDMYCLQ